MARVPTWTELRLDATKLAQLQGSCYRSVHDLLDVSIPELDAKLLFLNNYTHTNIQAPITKQHFVIQQPKQVLKKSSTDTQLNFNKKTIEKPKLSKEKVNGYSHKNCTFSRPDNKPVAARPFSPRKFNPPPNLEELEHLKPLPMPLCEYLKINRPEMVSSADRRVMLLKKKAERRKYEAASRIVNLLENIRLSSRGSSKASQKSSSLRSILRDQVAPDYQVKYKISEREMKRLTAKVYRRLPEVKKQRTEEVTKITRVQNYKNKLDYGRKLLENRRRGVINYPLRSSYDDSSLATNSHDSSLTSYVRSADAFHEEEAYY